MAWKIEYCKAVLVPDESKKFTAEQLRGYFGYLFIDDEGFHHHGTGNQYNYPKVQYKRLPDEIVLLGLGDYARKLQERVQEVERVLVPTGELHIRRIDVHTAETLITEGHQVYEFATPWIALNQHNYQKFKELTDCEKKAKLERILVGNVLSFLKAFGMFADFRICTNITRFKSVRVNVNKNYFEAFYVSFDANIVLPELIGLGKSVSKGFGVIKRLV